MIARLWKSMYLRTILKCWWPLYRSGRRLGLSRWSSFKTATFPLW